MSKTKCDKKENFLDKTIFNQNSLQVNIFQERTARFSFSIDFDYHMVLYERPIHRFYHVFF